MAPKRGKVAAGKVKDAARLEAQKDWARLQTALKKGENNTAAQVYKGLSSAAAKAEFRELWKETKDFSFVATFRSKEISSTNLTRDQSKWVTKKDLEKSLSSTAVKKHIQVCEEKGMIKTHPINGETLFLDIASMAEQIMKDTEKISTHQRDQEPNSMPIGFASFPPLHAPLLQAQPAPTGAASSAEPLPPPSVQAPQVDVLTDGGMTDGMDIDGDVDDDVDGEEEPGKPAEKDDVVETILEMIRKLTPDQIQQLKQQLLQL